MNASMKPSTTLTNPNLTLEALRTRLKRLNLYGLLAQAEQLLQEPWLTRMLEIEEGERQHRSLKRRLANARLLKYKSMADFDCKRVAEAHGSACRASVMMGSS